MIIASTDTETTGFLKPEHRIVEIGFQFWEIDTFHPFSEPTLLKEKVWRINPERDMPLAAERVHKISSAMLKDEPLGDTIFPLVQKVLDGVDLVVAHNGNGFDKPFIEQELARYKLSMPKKPWFDTMLEGRWATQYGKAPNLGELCWACGVEYNPDDAHSAIYDIRKMSECFFYGLKTGFYKPHI